MASNVKEDEIDQLASEDDFPEEEYDEDAEFRIKNALSEPRCYSVSTATLHDDIHQGAIELSPEYQRDVVWSQEKQVQLIDSLFRNYYVPPILLSVRPAPDGEGEVKICMDGKQRLTSIQRFIDGHIFYRDPATKVRYFFSGESGKARKILPEGFKKKFMAKQVMIVEYNDLSDVIERDIFQRVQLGDPLKAAERLQAISSPWADWIRTLIKKYFDSVETEGLDSLVKLTTKRAHDFWCLSQMTYYIYHGRTTPPATGKIDAFLRGTGIDPEPTLEFRKQVEGALSVFMRIASTPGWDMAFKMKQALAPVEFVACGLLLARTTKAPVEDKAQYLLELRKYLREHHTDVRTNGRVMSSVFDFVDSKVGKGRAIARTSGTAPGGPKSARAAKEAAPSSAPPKKGPGRPRKRKRADEEDEEDESYRPGRHSVR